MTLGPMIGTDVPPYLDRILTRNRGERRRSTAWALVAAVVTVALIVGVGHLTSQTYAGFAVRTPPGEVVAPEQARQETAVDDIVPALKRQAAALVAGDEAGWLSPVLAGRTDLVELLRAQYRTLRALGVTSFQPAVAGGSLRDFGGDAGPFVDLTVRFGYCDQATDCPIVYGGVGSGRNPTEGFTAALRWIYDGSHYRLVGYDIQPSAPKTYDRPPWLDTNMTMAQGARTTVAAASLSGRVASTLAVAEAAATVADRFAPWGRPGRYVVYLANPTEWKTWLSGPTWTGGAVGWAAYAIENSGSSDVVVVNMAVVPSQFLPELLRHEFGHVATLLGRPDSVRDSHLLTEGIAEYIAHDGESLGAYDRIYSIRKFIHSGRWNGDLEQLESVFGKDADQTDVTYAMGFYTWRCIAATFGRDKMMAFAGSVLRTVVSTDRASTETLGQSWAAVKSTCATYVRHAVG